MKQFPKPPKPILEHLYAEQRKTLHEIANLYGCSYQTVWRWLKTDNIHSPRLSRWKLVTLYCEQKLSSRQIATQTGYSFATILNWLKKHKIPIRKATKWDHKPTTFGDTIHYFQRQYRIDTRQLAQRTGIDAARLSQITRQTVIPTERERNKICEVLQFAWDEPIKLDEGAVLRERMSLQVPPLIAAIKEKHGHQHVQATMICPVCQETLHYAVSGVNGHTWGACETEGCLGWVE